jgi:chorismate lyase/3-hydroxybenzoate synthase
VTSTTGPTTIIRDTLQVDYLPAESAATLVNDPRVMALICFGDSASSSQAGGAKITVGLPQLNTQPWIEVWRTKRPVSWHQQEGITFCTAGDMLFGHMLLEEGTGSNLEALSEQAYCSLLNLTAQQGHPHLIRIWNYFPNINQKQGQQERYKSFCIGRHRACARSEGFENRLPAATAIGTHSPGFLIYFLASKTPGVQIENPRQVSAFYYPSIYSPKSPSFSRAMLKHWNGQSNLYISGTASVVGHETRHVDDSISQLQESARNIKRLLKEAQQLTDAPASELQKQILLKIYLRQAGDLAQIDEQINTLFKPDTPRIYLQADICRQDLLLEIDGYSTVISN